MSTKQRVPVHFSYKQFYSASPTFSTEGAADFQTPPEQQQLQNCVSIGGEPLPRQQQYPVRFECSGSEAGLPEQPAHPIVGVEGVDCGGQRAAQFLDTMHKTRDGENSSKLMDVTVQITRGLQISSWNMKSNMTWWFELYLWWVTF